MAGHGVVSGPALQRRMIRGWTPRRLRHPQFLPTSRRRHGIESQATKQNAPASFTASIGATVPQEIKLSPVPAKVANDALISNKLANRQSKRQEDCRCDQRQRL